MSEPDKPDHLTLSYLNPQFLKSPPARAIRILAEYLEPAERLHRARVRDTIVFFGSARSISPEEAGQRMTAARAAIEQADTLTPELAEAERRAEAAVRLSRYYQDAVELARRMTAWSKSLTSNRHFIICSGGSGGMMEAANRGASLAGGRSIGLHIHLSTEEDVNPYVSRDLIFTFHYFFMRKFWFVYPAKALVIFPGGFGTMDELFEVLTLIQTRKPSKTMPVVLFGAQFWNEIVNFEAMARWGVISPADLSLFLRTDSVDEAFTYLTTRLEELYLSPEKLDEVKLT
ncbi:MAG TPA: LOG family protein [Blastocatellia bacterium]|nr:LOG family protein [Blastocatellia bacterium]